MELFCLLAKLVRISLRTVNAQESHTRLPNVCLVGYDALPAQPPANAMENHEFLRTLHHALFNIDIVRGAFICPESGREFPIQGGVPNMILFENEVN
jgi:uncharacterized protein YbaR (Trm112 family)